MTTTNVIRQVSRSFAEEGREFVVIYELGKTEGQNESKCFIRVSAVEKCPSGSARTAGCNVDLLHLHHDVGLRLFETITCARTPVMPVHLPEIVRDELTALQLYDVKPAFR